MAMLMGPRQMLPSRPATPEAYRKELLRFAEKLGLDVVPDRRPLLMYVNEGRMVADCPHCRAGIAVHAEWPEAYCLECCHAYSTIEVPARLPEIVEAIKDRPRRDQSWEPTETVEDLRRENVELAERYADEQRRKAAETEKRRTLVDPVAEKPIDEKPVDELPADAPVDAPPPPRDTREGR